MDESTFRSLISGEAKGLGAAIARSGLTGLSLFYRLAIALRNGAFDRNWKRIHQVPVPVVSVGNLTTGGTGKTPFVAFLVHWFQQQGVKVGLLSRGYRALPDSVNDEKLVLDLLCPGVPHWQHPDRVASAQTASTEPECDLLILDDGFQHRRLARTLDIVLIDALNPFGYGRLLPRGLLREPFSSLKRADVIVLTRADQCPVEQAEEIATRIRSQAPQVPIVRAAFPAIGLRNSTGELAEFATFRGRPVGAFCGIGHPEAFWKTLDDLSFHVCWSQTFPDHHHYSTDELDKIAQAAGDQNLAALLVTQKDLVKIGRPSLGDVPLWSVEIGTTILDESAALDELLTTQVQLCRQSSG